MPVSAAFVVVARAAAVIAAFVAGVFVQSVAFLLRSRSVAPTSGDPSPAAVEAFAVPGPASAEAFAAVAGISDRSSHLLRCCGLRDQIGRAHV